ncbi:MAG: SsrA-binding protein SmpB [Candidatus Pacebacteria bacterium]|nr:SsrA-binding protein SmpB [Candidatus Paceibacterota bacterium]
MATIAENKKAGFDYEILEKIEAGIELNGQEVKSLRQRGASLSGSYVVAKRNKSGNPEIFWLGGNIPAYQPQNIVGSYDPKRDRKLLLNRKEIAYLVGKTAEKGLTLVPLSVYTKNRRIKMAIGVGRGKKAFDKRETIKKRDIERKIMSELKKRG